MAHQNSFTINIDRQKNSHTALDSNQQYHNFLLAVQKLTVHSISFIGDEDEDDDDDDDDDDDGDPTVPPS
ncbi:hypothetical protein [Anabaena lutea]|uniref:Uncharacterized protein n=1 Tax=Anabaena lutea FACHB-196 TaxID=2692881 RepID=A0ABR8FCR1_9NOST|nr:hypothetical protein [Anabaena lutea]MBD2568018.1 hypothetical protein [Anabaena lutea FACHB-196]